MTGKACRMTHRAERTHKQGYAADANQWRVCNRWRKQDQGVVWLRTLGEMRTGVWDIPSQFRGRS
ncbi:hypothetical protein sS8_5010 [Methylocaldum marinum]|uniref:Uncharacterized protein n=1 Tax=Methylocaldum marinum TaxID=1432792 RepID=A0A250KZ23_9GAMM|nr:hypothetical protein sS8_5010 [Methylocaldum marinum]